MSIFSFENQGTHTYLVYTVAGEDTIDSLSLGMLTNNKIHGLAHTHFTQMDSEKYIKYDVSSKIPVKQFFFGVVNKKRLLGVFNGIVDAILSAEDYMLDINSILFDLDYIFVDVSTCETVMVCLPVISDDLCETDISSFFRNIMITTQFDQTENCDYMAKILNFLNSNPMFSVSDFKKVLLSMEENSAVNTIQQPVAQPVVQPPVQQAPQPAVQSAPVNEQPAQPVAKPAQPAQAKPQRAPQPPAPKAPPKQPPAPPAPKAPAGNQGAQEEKISWFYLMQHYNSENAAKYKAQKANKKAAAPVKAPQQPAPRPANVPNKPNQNPGQFAFAVPGQQPAVPNTPSPAQAPVPPAQQSAPRPVQQPVQPKAPVQQPVVSQPVYTQPQMPQGQTMNFGETTVLGGGSGIGETTVLGASPASQTIPNLIRTRNNEKIILNKPVFRIGKERSYVDYFIGDNSAISRSHANIISRDGEYFVVDTNSTNHTYVDGVMLQSNVETKITHGSKIRLANEDFEFKLY